MRDHGGLNHGWEHHGYRMLKELIEVFNRGPLLGMRKAKDKISSG
jgi:hypothetical protein